jgi:hypothetical protein
MGFINHKTFMLKLQPNLSVENITKKCIVKIYEYNNQASAWFFSL